MSAKKSPEWTKLDPEIEVFDGAVFAASLLVQNSKTQVHHWEVYVVRVFLDDAEELSRFRLLNHDENGDGEVFDSWDWYDFEYVMPLNHEARKSLGEKL